MKISNKLTVLITIAAMAMAPAALAKKKKKKGAIAKAMMSIQKKMVQALNPVMSKGSTSYCPASVRYDALERMKALGWSIINEGPKVAATYKSGYRINKKPYQLIQCAYNTGLVLQRKVGAGGQVCVVQSNNRKILCSVPPAKSKATFVSAEAAKDWSQRVCNAYQVGKASGQKFHVNSKTGSIGISKYKCSGL